MQSTILFLQQELKLAKDTVTTLERENTILRNGDNSQLKPHYKDDLNLTADDSNISDNYILNGTKNHLNLTNNLAPTNNDTINPTTIYNSLNNCDRVINNCTKQTSTTSNYTVLIETRTLRNSGRNINSVVDELRTTKLKSQYVGNGNNGDSVDLISGSEQKKNGNNDAVTTSTTSTLGTATTIPTTSQRKLPYKRCYSELSEHKIIDDKLDDSIDDGTVTTTPTISTILSNSNYNNNKGNCIDNNGSGMTSNIVGECITTVVNNKKMRRSSILSLDLNDDDSHDIDLKNDEHPLNLVTQQSASAAAAANSTETISSPRNGII